MGHVARKFEMVEGSLGSVEPIANDWTNDPLTTDAKWLSTDDLAALAGVVSRITQRALKARRWRGADLVVREVASSVGQGGKILQVHVDSLPADLREAWYLERGVVLHQKVLPENGQTILVPNQVHETDARFEADLAVARWRRDVIRPALALKARSPERSAKTKLLYIRVSKRAGTTKRRARRLS